VADRPSSSEFDDLYRKDWARLCKFVFVIGATWEEARDVAQDAYVKLLENFDVECPEAWVRTVATRNLIDLRRDEDAARLSPLGYAHINMLGRYTFPAPSSAQQLRSLRDPDAGVG
jgi:DNA-directed RNA polymerase specialized sigma24 family protein